MTDTPLDSKEQLMWILDTLVAGHVADDGFTYGDELRRFIQYLFCYFKLQPLVQVRVTVNGMNYNSKTQAHPIMADSWVVHSILKYTQSLS